MTSDNRALLMICFLLNAALWTDCYYESNFCKLSRGSFLCCNSQVTAHCSCIIGAVWFIFSDNQSRKKLDNSRVFSLLCFSFTIPCYISAASPRPLSSGQRRFKMFPSSLSKWWTTILTLVNSSSITFDFISVCCDLSQSLKPVCLKFFLFPFEFCWQFHIYIITLFTSSDPIFRTKTNVYEYL